MDSRPGRRYRSNRLRRRQTHLAAELIIVITAAATLSLVAGQISSSRNVQTTTDFKYGQHLAPNIRLSRRQATFYVADDASPSTSPPSTSRERPTKGRPAKSSRFSKRQNRWDRIAQLQERTRKSPAIHTQQERQKRITINGRKFDQINPIECVDDEFYNLLSDDLNIIEPANTFDTYSTYYDDEHAKAINAILDTPTRSKPSPKEASNSRAPTGAAETEPSLNGSLSSEPSIVQQVRSFWNQTLASYTGINKKLDEQGVWNRVKADAAVRTTNEGGLPQHQIDAKLANHQLALANLRYLLGRLEELKMMLLTGEEAVVLLNNRVKKLNQAVGEPELQQALCSCVGSRSGRLALSTMNEVFNDRDTAKYDDPNGAVEEAKRKAKSMAADTAEFCAYWYGDTLRSQAVQKEKQIKRLVWELKQMMINASAFSFHKSHTETFKETNTTTEIKGDVTRTVKTERMRTVVSLVEMTAMWLPRLSDWIRQTLNMSGGELELPALVDSQRPTSSDTRRRRRAALFLDEGEMSDPLGSPLNYADVDDSNQLETSGLLQAFVANNYPVANHARFKRSRPVVDDYEYDEDDYEAKETSPPDEYQLDEEPLSGKSRAALNPQPEFASKRTSTTTTLKPEPSSRQPRLSVPESAFERRITEHATRCAVDGFNELLRVGADQNKLMFASELTASTPQFVDSLKVNFEREFAATWVEHRDDWSRKLAGKPSATNTGQKPSGKGPQAASATLPSTLAKSVDEIIDTSLEPTASAYERGVRLGYTLGKFIGDKAARQWPDPAELNTFTYDSLFLAGVGEGYSEEQSRQLERLIVGETVKRLAFTEANRKAFAKALHSAYLNGAFLVPQWGVLHAQRSVAKRAAKEGGRLGYEAASQAAREFTPKAIKFFTIHKHQRALSKPYLQPKQPSSSRQVPQLRKIQFPVAGNRARGSSNGAPPDAWAAIGEHINEVALESEVNSNISLAAVDCGQKSGTLMGALVALIVVPEAFETYARHRGSIEALEMQFNEYKLGALRGYELGETWAYLNYSVELRDNARNMKRQMVLDKGPPSSSPGASRSGNSLPEDSEAIKRINKFERELSSSNLFDTSLGNETNVSNVFQHMVLNYGDCLIANHSRHSMLKMRALSPVDSALIQDLKTQSRDLVANESVKIKKVGEVKGVINLPDPKNPGKDRLKTISLDLFDLSPMIEFVDSEVANSNNQKGRNLLEIALASDTKVFIQLKQVRSPEYSAQTDDLVSKYLNSDQYDSGDGYLSGTYNKIGNKIQSVDGKLTGREELEELALLDQIYKRIEETPVSSSATAPAAQLMASKRVTVAPEQTESIHLPAGDGARSGKLPDSSEPPTTTTSAPTTTAEEPIVAAADEQPPEAEVTSTSTSAAPEIAAATKEDPSSSADAELVKAETASGSSDDHLGISITQKEVD